MDRAISRNFLSPKVIHAFWSVLFSQPWGLVFLSYDMSIERLRKWVADNPDKSRAASKKWREANSDKVKAAAIAWRKVHPEYLKKWRKANPEKARISDAKYRKAHPEKRSVACNKWKKAHPEKVKANYAKWKKDNSEQVKANNLAWRKAHPERIKALWRAWRKANPDKVRSAVALRRATCEKVERTILFRRDEGRCHLCGKKVKINGWHLDHIVPLSKGGEHSYRNVAVACPRCNMQKGPGRLPSQLRLFG